MQEDLHAVLWETKRKEDCFGDNGEPQARRETCRVSETHPGTSLIVYYFNHIINAQLSRRLLDCNDRSCSNLLSYRKRTASRAWYCHLLCLSWPWKDSGSQTHTLLSIVKASKHQNGFVFPWAPNPHLLISIIILSLVITLKMNRKESLGDDLRPPPQLRQKAQSYMQTKVTNDLCSFTHLEYFALSSSMDLSQPTKRFSL